MISINQKGQSLIELMVAIAVIEVGIFAVWSLFLVNFNAEREAEMRIVGVNLAKEGVEVVKNIRDTNWLKNASNELDSVAGNNIWAWDRDLSAGVYSVNFDSTEPATDLTRDSLYSNGDGFFTNVSGGNTLTPYKRRVYLNDICCADTDDNFQCDSAAFFSPSPAGSCGASELKIGVNVVSKVTWQIKGDLRSAIVEGNIFNWQ